MNRAKKIYSPDFDQAKELLNNLFEEVKSKESQLSGGTDQELTRGATAIKRLQETQVKFTDPDSRLIRLTVEGFKSKGVELSYEIQSLMNRFDFYSMVINVNPSVQESVLISSLECQLLFLEKDQKSPLVHRIIPDNKWQNLVSCGANINLGLDANLDIGAGLDASELIKVASLPDYCNLKGHVGTKDEFKAFWTLENLNYNSGKFIIFAQGVDSSECFWRIKEPEIQSQSTVTFDIIFKVPQGWNSIDLVGKVWIEPSIDWLNGELTDVIPALPSYLKNVFGSKDRAAKSFAVGNKETWTNIVLPTI